jgi:hypothetical protein
MGLATVASFLLEPLSWAAMDRVRQLNVAAIIRMDLNRIARYTC